jgi:hypothetical protein
MKKQLLCVLTLGLAVGVNAQVNSSIVSAKKSRNDISFPAIKTTKAGAEKAEGDILYSNNFSTTSDWTMTTGAGHTAGAWAIVGAMPGSLTSQAGTYGFPVAIGSASGGNFALIDSDGAGAGAVQNAYIGTAADIDVAGALTTASEPADAAILLKFTEIYRHYQETYSVDISIDGGTNWTTFSVNPVAEVPVNTNSANPETEILNITSAIGAGNWTSNVRIRFHYQGTYDWFWGVDDVQLIVAYDNEIKGLVYSQATDMVTTQGLDYYKVPVSQASFPGVTFGATVRNDGGLDQPDVALNATAPSYDESGAAIAIPMGVTDSVSVTVPYMLPMAVGNYTIDLTTEMTAIDAVPANNEASFTISRDATLYARDNGTATGSISGLQGMEEEELKIGNLYEIFDDVELVQIQVRLVNQTAAVGQVINAEIYVFNPNTTEFDYGATTVDHTIVSGDLSTFVSLDIDNGSFPATAGDVLLVVAHNFGGTSPVAFGYAQNTALGTVMGFQESGDLYNLSDPNAIMIRLVDEASAGVEENALESNLSVFPNPASDVATVTFEVAGAENATVNVTDLAGKTVATVAVSSLLTGKNSVEINTTEMAAGVYTVALEVNGTVATKKLVVRK